ncbi:MAG: nickel-dependent lactate racemase, partial [Alicyclobacillus sp.]|nr:nickel-dependent lactate racemase [Alicyclobacillus sp.]
MDVLHELLHQVPLPWVLPVRQRFDRERIRSVEAAVAEAVAAAAVAGRIRAGSKVALAVGSRGIAQLPALVRATVGVLRRYGAEPFVVPAMGSHGGATAEGQAALLARLGVSEQTVGAPVRSSMEVVEVGVASDGLPLYTDALAAQADGIVLLNRIKPHTSFRGPVESGLLKMLVIGLGKQKGAEMAHIFGFPDLSRRIQDRAAHLLTRLPVWFGVGVIENAYDELARIVVLPAERLLVEEPVLLEEARRRMARILLPDLDVLVVDEAGKDISGVGMDPNVTGRYPTEGIEPGLRIRRIVVLRLTEKTDGNAAGLGLADVT